MDAVLGALRERHPGDSNEVSSQTVPLSKQGFSRKAAFKNLSLRRRRCSKRGKCPGPRIESNLCRPKRKCLSGTSANLIGSLCRLSARLWVRVRVLSVGETERGCVWVGRVGRMVGVQPQLWPRLPDTQASLLLSQRFVSQIRLVLHQELLRIL